MTSDEIASVQADGIDRLISQMQQLIDEHEFGKFEVDAVQCCINCGRDMVAELRGGVKP